MKNGIYWLASYPKSGNTWFRAFLANLLENSEKPVLINAMSTSSDSIGSSRTWLDSVLGFDSANLYQSEIDSLRPEVYTWTTNQSEENSYHKIHDACWQLESGEWLASTQATLGAIYFLRNPLDVAISYANHSQWSIDEAIKRMSEPGHCLCKNRYRSLKNQTEQRLLTWSEHVISWVDNPAIKTHLVRYEDMKNQEQQIFTGAVNFLQLPSDSERIARALHFSDFKVLQQQEASKRFKESPPNVENFFRKGIAGDWQQALATKQIDQIIKDHGEVMHRFGYLDDDGNPQIM